MPPTFTRAAKDPATPAYTTYSVRHDLHVNDMQIAVERIGAGVCHLLEYGAVVDGATNDSAAWIAANAAATALTNGGVVVVPTGITRLSANVTLDADVTLQFQPGAQVTIDTGVSLTLGGGLVAPPDRTLFLGLGTVVLTTEIAGRGVSAAWWGVVGDAKYVTDPTAPGGALVITSATAAFPASVVGQRYFLFNPALVNTTQNTAEKVITGSVTARTSTTITVTITAGTAAGGGATLTAIPATASGNDTTHTYNDGSTFVRRRALVVGTDCTPMLQKCVDAVGAAMATAGRYGLILLPPGNLLLATGATDTDPGSDQGTATNQGYNVRLKSNVYLKGVGRGVTTVLSAADSLNGFLAHSSTTNPCTNLRLSDMTLRSTGTFNDPIKILRVDGVWLHDLECVGGAYPFQIMGCRNTLVERVKAGQVIYAGAAAFSIVDQNSPTGDTPQGTASVTLRDCEAFETGHGYRLSGDDATVGALTFASRPIRVTLDNCTAHHGATYDNNGTGFVLTKVWGVRLRGCSARSMNYGIFLDTCEGVKISDALIVANEQVGVFLSGSTRCSVIGGEIFNNGTAGTQTIGVWCTDNGAGVGSRHNVFMGIHHRNDTAYGTGTMARQATGFFTNGTNSGANLFIGNVETGDNPAGTGYTANGVAGTDIYVAGSNI